MLRKLTLVAFLVALLAVITGSVLPAEDMPHARISDKLAHVVAYAVLALTGGVTFRGARPPLDFGRRATAFEIRP